MNIKEQKLLTAFLRSLAEIPDAEIEKVLGYKPVFSLEMGLKELE